MTERITIEMSPGEAIIVHGRLTTDAAYAALRLSKMDGAPEAERAMVALEVSILNRVCARISAELYPPCDSLEECDRTPVAGERYCRFHLDRRAGRTPVYAA